MNDKRKRWEEQQRKNDIKDFIYFLLVIAFLLLGLNGFFEFGGIVGSLFTPFAVHNIVFWVGIALIWVAPASFKDRAIYIEIPSEKYGVICKQAPKKKINCSQYCKIPSMRHYLLFPIALKPK